jgi:hypothetical protein
MISLLPAMLGVPMEEIVPILPLRDHICEALAGAMNRERALLSWLEFHEAGDWTSCDRLVATHQFRSNELIQCYLKAVSWAEKPSEPCQSVATSLRVPAARQFTPHSHGCYIPFTFPLYPLLSPDYCLPQAAG